MRSAHPSKLLTCTSWLFVAGLTACQPEAPPPAEPPTPPLRWEEARRQIRDRVLERATDLARDDGWVYTVDVAQLLEAAARMGDRTLYDAILPTALRARVEWRQNPYVRGFVAWRTHPSEPNDATGTTEALRLARALWEGDRVFGRPGDRDAALEILDGYRRHEYVDQGIWLIRNYYNLNTGAFATNSFLVDYDPDFVRAVAGEAPELAPLSANVDALVRGAITKLGFVHELVQPEILTALPHLGTATFSPNGKAQLSNSCAVLERALGREREAAASLLRFAHERAEGLGLIYDASSGARHPEGYGGVETYGCLTRLAHRLGTSELAAPFRPKLAWFVRDFLENDKQPFAYIASELLLTAATVNGEQP